jgi:hypothetical protein
MILVNDTVAFAIVLRIDAIGVRCVRVGLLFKCMNPASSFLFGCRRRERFMWTTPNESSAVLPDCSLHKIGSMR